MDSVDKSLSRVSRVCVFPSRVAARAMVCGPQAGGARSMAMRHGTEATFLVFGALALMLALNVAAIAAVLT